MVPVAAIVLFALLIAIPLLMPPAPGLLGLFRTFGIPTPLALGSVAIAGAVLLIVFEKR